VKYLGHLISKDGIKPDPENETAVKDMKAPQNIKELQSFLGMVNFYRLFVPKFSEIAYPLNKLEKKDESGRLTWK
jgi:hypothetical protein